MSATQTDGADRAMAGKTSIAQCWSCQGPVAQGQSFCPTCQAIQPPGNPEHFAQLAMEPTFDVDLAQLEQNYFRLQRTFHPDSFAAKSAKEQEFSLRHTTNLNDALKTLKSPVLRAEYLLQMRGAPAAGGPEKTVNDEGILMEAMETREALAEADSPSDVEAIVAVAQAGILDCTTDLSVAFADGDLTAASALTLRLTYLFKLDDEAAQRARILSRSA
ncbi:MAG: Fe-S protein assembly co-chaperone HscB [Alphaproteobacteria bacterium]|jgi:molecular chaperone HscB|nr:Fe-S protein assembly co-chaperone HscB [Alphaproteobacteria bacterium]MBT4709999.1 Fe-S protein assembly co-chaperone HscB [Alphaproteobacteria bacterium]